MMMLRVPKARVDVKALKPYFVGGNAARLSSAADHLALDFTSDPEEPAYAEESQRGLGALSPRRAELMRGELRPAYLAWLLAVQTEDVEDDAAEPPVPAGLAELTAAQEAMVDFLRIDVDLVAAAASGSPATTDDHGPMRRRLLGLSIKEKDAWLRRAADEPDLALGCDLLRAFRATLKGARGEGRRMVGELHALADTQRGEREKAEAVRARKAAEAARQRHLGKVSRDLDGAWAKLEKLVDSSAYDDAVKLAVDLRDLAARDGNVVAFAKRFEALRKRYLRRHGFLRSLEARERVWSMKLAGTTTVIAAADALTDNAEGSA